MAYLGRLYREVLERMAWYRMKQNRQRLHQLRTEQMKRKKGRSETLAETVLNSLKKAEIALTAAAFERSHHGSDPVLIEQQQRLRYCIEILLDREELFNIIPVLTKSIDSPKSVSEEVLEATVVDMYNFDARLSTKPIVHSHETGQDLIMPPVAGPPGSIVPPKIRSSQYWHEDQLGVDPNTQLLRVSYFIMKYFVGLLRRRPSSAENWDCLIRQIDKVFGCQHSHSGTISSIDCLSIFTKSLS